MSAPIALNSENYPALDASIQTIIKGGKRALISIYTNAEGTTMASDTHGVIDKREILTISYTASYKDADGNDTNPFVVVKFKHNGDQFVDYFTSIDYVEDHWYKLDEQNIPFKTF
uniref:Uncharacterized protein n=1 Tax=viral metagenome TaxID=1070528 RepID=A0A6C0IJI5_9ZZZZ